MDSALAAPKDNDSNMRFRIVTGKGGVGKSVVACAIALAEAKKGKRVLLAEAQGRDQATALLGAKPVGFEMREVLENLFIVDINPQDAIREYALLLRSNRSDQLPEPYWQRPDHVLDGFSFSRVLLPSNRYNHALRWLLRT